MFAISLAVVIVQVVRCTLDPKTIPMFKTNLSIVFPVYRGKEIFSSSQLTENPQAFQTVLTTTPERKLKFTVTTKNVFQQILPAGFPKTEVYAYGGDCSDSLADQPLGQVFGWPGPAFRVPTQTKLEITWRNALKGAHMFQIERNLHFMHKVINFDNFIPTVAHIHGMPSQSKADGGPEGWFTSNGTQGSKYST